MHQDADVYAAVLEPGTTLTQPLQPGRHAWLQVASGSVKVNGTELRAGDGAAISDEPALQLSGNGAGRSEFLLFDLA